MNSSKKIKFFVILFPTFAFFYLLFDLKIKSISCTSQFGPCSDRQYSELNQYLGKRLFSKIIIKDAKISRKLPSTLVINLELRPSDFKVGENLIVVNKQVYKADFSPPLLKFNIQNTQVILDVNHLGTNWQSTLQKLLTQSKISGKVPKIIDLRFSQPVLTY
jgi:hypothetical protein